MTEHVTAPILEVHRHSLAILRLAQVKARTGLSRSTIYQRVSDGTFPKQISLGARAVGWIEESITDWIEQQIVASRKVAS